MRINITFHFKGVPQHVERADVSFLPSSPPAAEIEQVSGLFQEKQGELQSAVLRVEQLSLQLEDLRRGKLNGIQTALGGQVSGAAALELRKLYQELQVPFFEK